MLGYGTGYIHSIKGVAHASDALCDLIPADAVSALIVTAAAAAAASGPGDGTAKVYHATSADSHPCSIRQVYQAAATFWASNPCPFKVPFARSVGLHQQAAVTAGWLKVLAAFSMSGFYGHHAQSRGLQMDWMVTITMYKTAVASQWCC
jgi:hypothetical protein